MAKNDNSKSNSDNIRQNNYPPGHIQHSYQPSTKITSQPPNKGSSVQPATTNKSK